MVKRTAKQKQHIDGWENELTGIGTRRDKVSYGRVKSGNLDHGTCATLYRSDDMAARIVDTLPDEMTREGFELKIPDDAVASEAINGKLEDLGLLDCLNQAEKLARLYGGAAIFVGVNDGELDLSKPLNAAKVKSVDFLTVFSAREMYVSKWYENPMAPKFGKPELYEIVPQSEGTGAPSPLLRQVHESRLLVFEGTRLDRSNSTGQRGFGDSILTRCYTVLSAYGQTWDSAANLLADFSQAVYKLKGLAGMVGGDESGALASRLETIDMARSTVRAVIVDADNESFERQATPLSGLPEMMDRFAQRLATAAGLPLFKLNGQFSTGLGSTGQSEIRQWYDYVSAAQRISLTPKIHKLVKLVFGNQEPEAWTVQWRPLWQESTLEKAQVRQAMAQVDSTYFNLGIVSQSEIRASRFGDVFSVDTQVSDELPELPNEQE